MALVVKDRVKETTTTTGTGTINLAGAVSGFQTFVAGVGSTNTTYYAIEDANGTAWEVGLGTVTDASPDTLARTTILANSNGDTSAITLSSGTHTVFATYPAGKAVYLDADGATSFNLTDIPDVSFGGTNLTGTILVNESPGTSPRTGSLTGDNQYNVGIGYHALSSITDADTNVAIGHFANRFLTTGYNNVSIGASAGEQMTTGYRNIQIGQMAHQYANDGAWNIAIGQEALRGNSDGTSTTENYNNIAIGHQALNKIETGDSNTAVGDHAGEAVTTGSQNVLLGRYAGDDVTTESQMLYIGYQATASDGTFIKGDMANRHLAIGMTDDHFVNSAGSPTLQVYPAGAADEAIFVKMPTSHSANLIQIQNSSGTDLFVVDSTGEITTGSISTLAVGDGGTGATSLTDGGILLGSGTGAVTAMSVLGDGVIVVGDNSTDPTTITAFTASDGVLKHEVGGLELDISAIAIGDVIAGTGTGSVGIVTSTGHSDGDVLTIQADGTVDWETPSSGGASNITGLSDALVENDSIYLGNDPSSTTSTAERNIVIGTTALDAVTTSDDNIAIGYNTGTAITGGLSSMLQSSKNILIGSYAGENLTTGSSENVFIGYEAGHGLVDSHSKSVVIGHHAGYSSSDDRSSYASNVHIGYQAGMEANNQYTVHIGPQAGEWNAGNGAVAIGDAALKGSSGTPISTTDTVAIGAGAGSSSTGDKCVYLGHNAGASNTSDKMLFIGWDSPSSSETIIKADMENKHVAVGVADSLTVSAGSPTFQVYTQDAADPAFYAKMAGSHSGNLIEIENNSGTDIFVVNSSGQVSTGTWQGTAIAQAYIANDAINGDKIADDVVDSEHYVAGSIDEEHLNATNSPTDNYLLSYDDSSGGFTWVAAGSGGEANEFSFKTISVSGQDDVVADTTTDTLTLAAGSNVTITTTAASDTVTIAATDTNTMGSGFTVSATTDSNATTITQGDDLMFAAGTGITCETTADGTVTISSTVTDTNTTYTGGTNLTLAGTTFNVDDAFLVNDADDTTTGTITAGGFTTSGTLTVDSVGITAIQTASESFADNDTSLMTSAAIDDRINAAVASEDTLVELNDTNISSAAAGHLIIYDNTASVWDNAALTAGSNISITNGDGSITIAATDTNTQLSQEQVEDFVGGMLGGTETGITVTYQDGTGDIDFVVSDTTVAGDSGSTGITPGDTLTIAGGTNVTTAMSGDTLTITATDTNTNYYLTGLGLSTGTLTATVSGASNPTVDLSGLYTAGDGIDLSSVTLSVDLKANGGLVIESTEVAVDLGASSITGTLAVGDGGTGATSLTDGGVLLGSGTGAVTATAVLTNGQLLIGDNSGDPTVATLSEGSAIAITNGAGSISIAVSGITTSNFLADTLLLTAESFVANDTLIMTSGAVKAYIDTRMTSIPNSALANSSVSLEGDSGSGTLDLGGTLTFAGDNGLECTVSSTTVTIGGALNISGGGVTGTLPVSKGGTGATSLTDGGVLLGSGTGAITAMAVLADGEIIVGDGSTDPVALAAFSSSTGTLKVANGGTGASSLDDITSANNLLTVTAGADTVIGGDVTLTVNQGNFDLDSIGGSLGLTDQVTGTLPVANGGTGATSLDDITSANNLLTVTAGTDTVIGGDVTLTVNEANIDHDALTNFVANEHIDWTQASAGTIHSSNYTDTNTTYSKASFDLDHLFTLVGASADTDEHLSTFTGSTISDNQTIKQALQALETAVETKGTGTVDVSGTPTAGHVAIWSDADTITFDSAKLFWDTSSDELGVGTNSPGSTLHVSGSVQFKTYTVGDTGDADWSSNIHELHDATKGANHYILCDTGNTNRTVELPDASSALAGRTYVIKKIDAGTGTVTIQPDDNDGTDGYLDRDNATVDDGTNILWVQFDTISCTCGEGYTDGQYEWHIVHEKVAPHTAKIRMEGNSGNIAHDTDTAIAYDTLDWAIGCGTTITGSDRKITINRKGKYSVKVQLRLNNTFDSGERADIKLYKNGTHINTGSTIYSPATNKYVYGWLDNSFELDVDDYLTVKINHWQGENAQIFNKHYDSSTTAFDPILVVEEIK